MGSVCQHYFVTALFNYNYYCGLLFIRGYGFTCGYNEFGFLYMLSLTGGYIGFFDFRGSNHYYFISRGFVFFGGFDFFDGKRRFRWLRHDTTHKTDTTRLPNNSN